MAGIGNNSNAQIKSFVERIERLSVQKMEIAEDIKDVFHEAKNAGFDVKALRTVLKNRRQNAAELAAHEATVAQYELALG